MPSRKHKTTRGNASASNSRKAATSNSAWTREGSSDGGGIFEPSPTPPESFSDDDEGANSNGEWALEIVGEVVDSYGNLKYNVRWENWSRPDGTSNTWDNSLIPPAVIRDWERQQEKRRMWKAKTSRNIRLDSTLSITDAATHARYEAFEEKINYQKGETPFCRILRQRMETQLGTPQNEPEHSDEVRTPVRRKSTRSRQEPLPIASSSRTFLVNSPWTAATKKRKMSASPVLSSGSVELEVDVSPPKRLGRPPKRTKDEQKAVPNPYANYGPRKVMLKGSCKGPKVVPMNESTTPSPQMATKISTNSLIRRERLAQTWTTIAIAAKAAYITLTNDVDDEAIPKLPPDFRYLERGYTYARDVPKAAELDEGLFLRCNDGRCCDPSRCDCQSVSELKDHKGNPMIAYNQKGLFMIDVTPGLLVIECNKFCKCDMSCPNRVSQRPRKIPIDIFKTKDRGWGVRPLCNVPKGTVLGMYSGKLVTRSEAEGLDDEDREYCFDLDGQENPYEEVQGHAEAFSVNARSCGNWTRFVNHSCSPNLQVYQAVHDTIPELNTPFIIFCASKNIPEKVELTVDYDPCASDQEVKVRKSKRKANLYAPKGAISCGCGEEACRRWVRVLS